MRGVACTLNMPFVDVVGIADGDGLSRGQLVDGK